MISKSEYKRKAGGMEKQEQDRKVYSVWVGELDRIASFHSVEGYRKESFACHDFFIQYLRQLQERGFRFQ